MSQPRRVLQPGPQSEAATVKVNSSYLQASFSAHMRGRGKPAAWRWPAFWALVAGFLLQLLFGIFATLISFFLLVAADPHRCPVALGADAGAKPLVAWLAGVVAGVMVCDACTTARGSSLGSWVVWGAVTELWRLDRLWRHLTDDIEVPLGVLDM